MLALKPKKGWYKDIMIIGVCLILNKEEGNGWGSRKNKKHLSEDPQTNISIYKKEGVPVSPFVFFIFENFQIT